MENKFTPHSIEVVNDFIQSIVFVDDRAYSTEKVAQDFDTAKVLSIFANEGKLCTVYTPSLIKRKDIFSTVLNKADAIVIDWDMRTPPVKTISLEQGGESNEVDNDENDEEDVPAEDPRGELACELVRDIAYDTDGIKVILIYTGDTKLRDICESIKSGMPNAIYDEENLNILNERIIIAVRAKYNDSEEQFKHDTELKKFIVKYEELPLCIIEQYIKFTDGLIPNFALKALSVIRHHTPKILSVFSKDLDMGYLIHKASMEFPEDSKNMLIQIFGDAISDLLNAITVDTDSWSDAWIESFLSEITKNIDGVSILRSHKLVKQLLVSNSEQLDLNTPRMMRKLFNADSNLTEKDKKKIKNNRSDLSSLFEIDGTDVRDSNCRFAILTHHKNIFLPLAAAPVLSLGTIVKDSTNQYFVCIQQRCDSVRLTGVRRFLFLPLQEKGKNPILVNPNLKLGTSKASYAIKTIKFAPIEGQTTINALKEDKRFIFKSVYGEIFEWITDLKDLQAQRIANNYTAELSRVGLDESEWLRIGK